MAQIQAIKGFADLFPEDSALFLRMEQAAREVFPRYAFGELRTPLLEYTAAPSARKPMWCRRKCIPLPTAGNAP